jgi:phosphosulfolactate synthase
MVPCYIINLTCTIGVPLNMPNFERTTVKENKAIYMNFQLNSIPERTSKPRQSGLTMVTDKGLSLKEVENFVEVASPHIDIVKLAFGTSYVTPNLRGKIEAYQSKNIPVYFGGLLFEAFIIRNQFEDFLHIIKDYGISYIEVSDGSIDIPHTEKCGYIEKLTKYGTVLSEVGSKDKDREHVTPPYKWIELMKAEYSAGASYVIAEARENGTVGLYRDSGEVREGLVQEILTKIPAEKIIWEAPRKDQQLYFLGILGCNANLGNIAFDDVIPLEAMRIGLRGDTFHLYLNGK